MDLSQNWSIPLQLELTDRLAIHWQHDTRTAGQDALPGKLQALHISQRLDAPSSGQRAFGDQLIPAKKGASPARMASQTRSNPLLRASSHSMKPEAGGQVDAAQSSQWDAWLLLAANGQDPVQLYAFSPVGIKGPDVRHVAAQAGPAGDTAAAFVEDYVVSRAGDGTLSSVPITACQNCSFVSHALLLLQRFS